MLHTISWQQYITAVLLFTVAWYIYVGLKYYQPELRGLLQRKPQPLIAPIHTVIGGIKRDPGTDVHENNELIFGNNEPDNISDATLPKGPADDLLAECDTLINAFAESGTKTDFLSLLNVLIDRYEIYRNEINLTAVSASLLPLTTKLPFPLTAAELELHWPAENYA